MKITYTNGVTVTRPAYTFSEAMSIIHPKRPYRQYRDRKGRKQAS